MSPTVGTDPVTLAHFSDTHVAFHQYPAKSAVSGRNQREQDVARAFLGCLNDINERDPELVIHSGDVADRAYITHRQQHQIQMGFSSITKRKDGSPRMVVVISGNHDMPSDPREPAHLNIALGPLPSVAVVTKDYEMVDLAPLRRRRPGRRVAAQRRGPRPAARQAAGHGLGPDPAAARPDQHPDIPRRR